VWPHIRDVDARADEAARKTRFRLSRNAVIQQPTLLAVRALKSVFHLKWWPLFETTQINLKAAGKIFFVNTLCPAVAYLLLEAGHGSPSTAC
jgi:hypothetical protein